VTLQDDLLARFAWVDGHADVWRLFADGELFRAIAAALAEPFRDVTKVAAVEARGFILGAAVAAELGVGFVAIRKEGGLLPGPKAVRRTERDYRGIESLLRLQRTLLDRGDRVVLVDDWAERGSQALAARALIEECGATFVGLAIVVDQLEEEVRRRLGRVHALVSHEQLGPSA
jgi:adenine phosphoribosyltransferase